MKLLPIDSSILGSRSKSRKLTAAIVAKLKRAQPQIEIVCRDLAATPPPLMTPASLPSNHPSSAFAGPLDDAQRARHESQRALDEFMAADIVVLGVPMYNWSIPHAAKSLA